MQPSIINHKISITSLQYYGGIRKAFYCKEEPIPLAGQKFAETNKNGPLTDFNSKVCTCY